jgi:hypothetical protein
MARVPLPRRITDSLRRVGVLRTLTGVVGLVVLLAPVILWAAGERATAVENRPFAARPALDQGWEATDQATAFFTDRVPVRNAAIDLRRTVSDRLFGEPPPPAARSGPVGAGGAASGGTRYVQDRSLQVLEGREGTLFFGEEFARACRPDAPTSETLEQVRRLALGLRAAGKRAAIVIVPDKSGVETELLPKDLPERGCAAKARQERFDGLRRLGLPEVVDVQSDLLRLRRSGVRPYLRLDTHVSSRGSATFLASVVRRLDPRVARSAPLERTGTERAQGDLTVIQGQPAEGPDEIYRFARPGVTVLPGGQLDPLGGFPLFHLAATGTRAHPVVPGRTAWFGDSFTERALPQMEPLFADLWRVPELTRGPARERPEEALGLVLDQFRQAENVVVELVERTAFGRAKGSIFYPPTVDRILAALREAPGAQATERR